MSCSPGTYNPKPSFTVSGFLCKIQINKNFYITNSFSNGYPTYSTADQTVFAWAYIDTSSGNVLWLFGPLSALGTSSYYAEGPCPDGNGCSIWSVTPWTEVCFGGITARDLFVAISTSQGNPAFNAPSLRCICKLSSKYVTEIKIGEGSQNETAMEIEEGIEEQK